VVERATHLLEDWRAAQIIRGSCVEHSSHDQPNSSQIEHSSSQELLGGKNQHRKDTNVTYMLPFLLPLTRQVSGCVFRMMPETLALPKLLGFLIFVMLMLGKQLDYT
jgi:hypothetical protein